MWLVAIVSSEAMFCLGVALLIFILLRRSLRYYRRRGSGRPQRPAVGTPSASLPLLDAPPEVLKWQVEMHELARDLKAELDSKISVLRAVTLEAQRQADRLQQAIARAAELGLTATADPLEQLADGLPASLLAPAACQCTAGPPVAQRLPGTDAQRNAIYRLADQGHPAKAIADKLRMAIGDVELALACRASRRRADEAIIWGRQLDRRAPNEDSATTASSTEPTQCRQQDSSFEPLGGPSLWRKGPAL